MGLTDSALELQGTFSPCNTWFGTSALVLNEWAHVAVGVDGTEEKHYIGGIRTEKRGCAGNLAFNNDAFRIGGISGDMTTGYAGTSNFKGFLDEVRKTPSWPRSWANFSLF
jgi:hypothetical protein